MVRRLFWILSIILFAFVAGVGQFWPDVYWLLIIIVPLFFLGIYDMVQRKQNVLRLYPLVGHLRFMLQDIRPQIQQYFIETNTNGKPFSREDREMVYARAKNVLDALPFGTQRDVHEPGFNSINHSMSPKKVPKEQTRITVGNFQCKKPYHASRLNISAMSFGALSARAIQALNRGAKLGNFYHNTGEGGLSDYHLKEGGDVVWQLGTAYFGCRNKDGGFDEGIFKEKANLSNVKMIEIKISQGAKPAHGGLLLASKITPEIAKIRHVEMGHDVYSPAYHTEFSTPRELLQFVARLRELTGGKPIGFKCCIGQRSDFFGICKAMLETKIYPDFITIDGAEGGTGAAPVEFTDFIGVPLDEGLVFAHNALVGTGVREHIRLICSGKIISGFDMTMKIALGADMCNSARGMMFSLGCIQSRRCHNNTCPTGVATQDPARMLALDINDKAPRVKNFHENTIESFLEVVGAAGLESVSDLNPSYIYKVVDRKQALHYDEVYEFLKPGQLLTDEVPTAYKEAWDKANPDKF